MRPTRDTHNGRQRKSQTQFADKFCMNWIHAGSGLQTQIKSYNSHYRTSSLPSNIISLPFMISNDYYDDDDNDYRSNDKYYHNNHHS